MKALTGIFLITALQACAQDAKKIIGEATWGKPMPCPTDTIRGIIYYAAEYGNNFADTGYYIARCGGIQIASLPYFDGEKAVKYPTWIPGRYLRRDEVDKKGNLIYKEFQEQYNTGYFTDKHFRKVQMSAVYGLMIIAKEAKTF